MATLAELETRVREKVDEDTATFWTQPVVNNQINEAYRYYWAFIIKLHEGYFTTTDNINFNSNSAGLYDLPTDFFKARLVSRILSNGKIPLRYRERYDYAVADTLGDSTYSFPTYRFRGAQILFEPAPGFFEDNAVELEYIKTLTNLSTSVAVDSEYPALGEDCVVSRAVIKCKEIEEMVAGGGADTAPFIRDLLTTEQMLKEALEQRTVTRQFVQPFSLIGNET
jgi:hypothetical protein